ncbi:uncharacterized protein G2W53_022035 [Senna tora]|uniref:Uncharacterized protein n=1 Tax=Senna tora TaxID=362788 RepID=A0A834W0S6_9FABA|nr:uncharacterized protein G2W53_044089 [Senna tora]KAF7823891.1 uncharacterized protein G2W53_022035 [Senna tora]
MHDLLAKLNQNHSAGSALHQQNGSGSAVQNHNDSSSAGSAPFPQTHTHSPCN